MELSPYDESPSSSDDDVADCSEDDEDVVVVDVDDTSDTGLLGGGLTRTLGVRFVARLAMVFETAKPFFLLTIFPSPLLRI